MEYNKNDIIQIIKNRGFQPLDFDWNGYQSIINFQDDKGYKYSLTWNSFCKNEHYKPIYSGNNKYALDNIKNYIKINGYGCIINQDIAPKTCEEKINFKGKCGHNFERSWTKFIQKNTSKDYCPNCYRKIKPHRQLISIEKYHSLFNKYGYTILENLNDGVKRRNDTKILVQDHNGYKGYLTYANLQSRKDKCKFAPFHKANKWSCNNIRTYFKNNNINTELISEQYKGIDIPLKFRCECGETFERIFPNSHLSYTCLKCSNSMSKYERYVEKFLQENNISYIKQKKFTNCIDKKELPFDFYLDELNICIEVQGEQHYKPIIFGNYNEIRAKELFEDLLRRDNIKKEFCKENNIPLITIKYDAFKDEMYQNILNQFILDRNISR